MPDCPKCRSSLVRRKNDFGVFWYCDGCEGSAVTMSLLRKMIPSEAMNGLWQRARLGSYPKKHNCPGCQRKMEEISVDGGGRQRAIDVCTSCQFVWLDEGEWADLSFFSVEKITPEAMQAAVRERIAKTRLARNPAVESGVASVAPPVLTPSKLAAQRPVEMPIRKESTQGSRRPASALAKSKSVAVSNQTPRSRQDSGESERRLAVRRRLDELKRRKRKDVPKRRSGWGAGPAAAWQWIPALLGMPVEDEQPLGPRQYDEKPWLTWVLAGGVAIVSLLALFDFRNVIDAYGLIPAEYGRLGGLTWLTSFFLHGSLLHLAGNVYFLVVFGDNVEKCLGTLEFFLLLCFATVSGHFFHILLDPDSIIPCVGASGGISGVIAFYALRFRQNQLAVVFWFFIKTYWLRMSAIWMFCLWVVLQFIVAGQQLSGISNVSGGAHLGGAIAGVFSWLVWSLNRGRKYASEGGFSSR